MDKHSWGDRIFFSVGRVTGISYDSLYQFLPLRWLMMVANQLEGILSKVPR